MKMDGCYSKINFPSSFLLFCWNVLCKKVIVILLIYSRNRPIFKKNGQMAMCFVVAHEIKFTPISCEFMLIQMDFILQIWNAHCVNFGFHGIKTNRTAWISTASIDTKVHFVPVCLRPVSIVSVSVSVNLIWLIVCYRCLLLRQSS